MEWWMNLSILSWQQATGGWNSIWSLWCHILAWLCMSTLFFYFSANVYNLIHHSFFIHVKLLQWVDITFLNLISHFQFANLRDLLVTTHGNNIYVLSEKSNYLYTYVQAIKSTMRVYQTLNVINIVLVWFGGGS